MSEVEQVLRLRLNPVSSTPDNQVKINVRRSSKYPQVTWGINRYPMCAVVGGGPSVSRKLEMLRNWPGDIFAINDTAGYLSDNGIPCYLYAIDGIDIPFKIGALVMGALFAGRVDRVQFKQMQHLPIRVFNLAEDINKFGVEGGPTAGTRAPHLMLAMGYRGVMFFGMDGSYEGDMTHVSGKSKWAYENLIIIRAGGKDYVSHAGFLLQAEFFIDLAKTHSHLIFHASEGLLPAMMADPDKWSVVAIAEDLKQKYVDLGSTIWNKEYKGKWPSQQEQAS